jgi:superfamily I DNA and RNA helicase
VRSYHQLYTRWADAAGVPLHWPERRSAAFFEQVLPEALDKAAERTGPAFDAIVVDEAQDFARTWWTSLLRLLRDGDDGILYVFADDNQRLYRRPAGLPEGLFPFTLNQNWRNTRRINTKVAEFYSGHAIVCMGPQGLPVEIHEAATVADVRRVVLDTLGRLVREDEVPAGDIVVLTPGAVQSSGLLGPLGDELQLAEEPNGPDEIRLESVYRFKGMEATVVVLAGVPRRDQAQTKPARR